MATAKKTAQQWFLEAYHHHLLEQSIDKAIKAYKKCIQLDPAYTDAYVNLGLIHLKREQYDKALQYFARVTQLEPDNIEAYINLGYAYEKMDRFGSAKQMYEHSLKINPRHMEAFINLANIAEMQPTTTGPSTCGRRPSRSIQTPPSPISSWLRRMTGTTCSTRPSRNTGRPSQSTPTI